jgi:hypothetical protein
MSWMQSSSSAERPVLDAAPSQFTLTSAVRAVTDGDTSSRTQWIGWTASGIRKRAFAAQCHIRQPDGRRTDSISQGDLIREGSNERMVIAPTFRRGFIYQGVLETERAGKAYGQIPWRLERTSSRCSEAC